MLRRAIDGYLLLLDERPTLFRFVTENRLLSRRGSDEPTSAEYSGSVTAVLTEALAEQLAGVGLDPAAAQPWGEAVVGFIRAAGLWWLDHPDSMSRAQLTDYLGALLWGGAAGVYQAAGHETDPRPAPHVFPPVAGTPPT